MSITTKINSCSSRKDWHVWVFEVMIYTSMSLPVFLWLHVKVFPLFLGSGAIWTQHTCKIPIKLNDHLNPFSQKHKVSTNVLLKEHWIEPPPLILFNIITLTQTEFINCHLSAQIIICFGLLSKQKSGHSACKLHIDLSKGETVLMFVIPYMESYLFKNNYYQL